MDKIQHKIGIYFAEFILKLYQKNPDRYIPYYQEYFRYYSDEGIPIINGKDEKGMASPVAVS
jgi:hypothetical protein